MTSGRDPIHRFTAEMLAHAGKDLQAPDPRTWSKAKGRDFTRHIREWASARASAAYWLVSPEAELYFAAHGYDQGDSLRRINWRTHAEEVLTTHREEGLGNLSETQVASIVAALDFYC